MQRLDVPKSLLWLLASWVDSKASLVDAVVRDGDMLPLLGGLRVIHTPGHTSGSICLLLEKSKLLFTGDTIINNEDRLSRPLPFGADRLESEQSLMKLAKFDFDTCYFGTVPLYSKRAVIMGQPKESGATNRSHMACACACVACACACAGGGASGCYKKSLHECQRCVRTRDEPYSIGT